MTKKALLLLVISLLPLTALPQQIAITDTNTETDKLEKSAVELLEETKAEVDGLRLIENRISFTSELAALMWFHDEREARAMYSDVINDFRQLLVGYDSQMNQFGIKQADEPQVYGSMFMTEPSDRQKIEQKFRVAVGVRQTIATSMAEHDPELALNFFYDSLNAVANVDLRKQMEANDRGFENKLLVQIAAIDPAKAAVIAKRTLSHGITMEQVDLLKKYFGKDPDKAIDFGETLLSAIKSEKSDSLDLGAASSLLKYGTQVLDQSRTIGGKKTIFSDSDLRDLAEVLAQAVLARPNDSGISFANYAKDVERYQPGRAVQIRSKVPVRSATTRNGPPAGMRSANATNSYGTFVGNSNTSNTAAARAAAAAQAQREASEKRLMDDVNRLGTAKLTQEQRDKIILQARTTIMSMPGADKKITTLSLLAGQVAKAGDKDLAAEIMRDAASFVNPQPRNMKDFMLTWMLTSGYASVDPEKAFPMLEDLVNRGNDLIDASLKIAEFVDVTEEIVSDGEFQLGAFGGNMIRDVTRALNMADSTIQNMSRSDFQKMRSLTNRFDRPEIRVMAKMLVLQSVLGAKALAEEQQRLQQQQKQQKTVIK